MAMLMLRALAIVIALSNVAVAGRATAKLVVDAHSAACIERSTLQTAITKKIGRDPFSDDDPNTIHVSVTEIDAGIHARVERRDAGGSRGVREVDVAGDDCGNAVETIAFVIAVALDPVAAMEPDVVQAPPSVGPASARSVHASIALFGSLGSAPGPTAGIAIAGGLQRRQLSLELTARADLGAAIAVPPGEVRAAARLIEIAGCWNPALEICAVAGVGWLAGNGTGFEVDRHDRSPLVVGGVRAARPFRVGSVWLVPSVEVLGNIVRTHLDLDGRSTWTSPPVQGAIGVGARLPL